MEGPLEPDLERSDREGPKPILSEGWALFFFSKISNSTKQITLKQPWIFFSYPKINIVRYT